METPQQEIYRLQCEISRRLDRINELQDGPPIENVVGTTSNRMRRYMNAISDRDQPQLFDDAPYVSFPKNRETVNEDD